jgi:Family of unknown function (DUF6084)
LEAPLPTAAPAPAAPRLAFAIKDAGVLDPAAIPTLRLDLRIESSAPVRSLALNVQVRIAATRRRYSDAEERGLAELFGRPDEWSRNLKSIHWTNLALQVPAFTDATVVELPMTCTYDLEVSASRYLNALDEGEVPLEFLLSGSVFYAGPDGRLQVRPIGWDQEAGYRLPVTVWREMMDRHFPDSAWLRLRRDAFERLREYRARHALLTWEETVDALLRRTGD